MIKINISNWILSILFFLYLNGSFGQQYIYKNFNTTHGLPSSECFDVIQDSKGYIWIATDNGIAKYNGQRFNVFDQNDGMKSNVVFRLLSKNNKIWFFTHDNYLQYIENDSVKSPSFSTNLKFIVDSINATIDELSVSLNGSVIVSLVRGERPIEWIKISQKGEIQVIKKESLEEYRFCILSEVGHSPVCSGVFSDSTSQDHKSSLAYLHSNVIRNSFQWQLSGEKLSIHEDYSYEVQGGKLKMFCIQNKIFSFHNNIVVDSIQATKQLIGSLIKIDSNSYALGRQGKALVKFHTQHGKLNEVDSSNVSLSYISGGLMDREGGLWLTSLKSGVFYIGNPYIYSFPNPLNEGRIKGLITHQEKNWVAKDDYDLYSINPINQTVDDHYVFNEPFCGFKKLGSKLLVLNLETEILNDDSLEFIGTSAKGAITFGDTLVIAGPLAVYIVLGEKYYRIDTTTSGRTVYKCVNRNKNALYFGTLKGLQKYQMGSQTFVDEQTLNPEINIQINAIEKLGDKLLLASNGNGIIIIDKNDSIVSIIDEKHGLSNNFCNSIYKSNSSTFWISTKRGLTKLSISDSLQIKTQIFNQSHGLLSNEVLCCNRIGNYLYVGTRSGLCNIDLRKKHFNATSPTVYIEKIIASDSLLNSGDTVQLKHTMNDLQFFFSGLTFKQQGQFKFKYRLLSDNEQSEFKVFNQSQIRFPNLSPGNYLFEVLAINNDGIESNQSAHFSFTILPPWWATWWFKLGMVLFVGLAIYGILKFRFEQLKKKNELETRTKELKQMALNAQLNPHFIFNSMGSIQSLIMDGELFVAENYLTKFSKLLRSVINRSSEHFSILGTEIKQVKEYVNIENLRFNDKIELVIEDNAIDTNKFKIPAMLVHTIVENAIIHGILPSKKQGQIKISINISGSDQVSIKVIDNGIGLVKSKARKEKQFISHESKGLSIIQDRLSTYSSLYKDKFSITYTDLGENGSNISGTKVELVVPCKPV